MGVTATIQSLPPEIPCGQCIECTHGRLYNGHVVDKGGYHASKAVDLGGIVNTNLTSK
jgi:hypothetical protein